MQEPGGSAIADIKKSDQNKVKIKHLFHLNRVWVTLFTWVLKILISKNEKLFSCCHFSPVECFAIIFEYYYIETKSSKVA